jgi:hypothetical protein
MNLRQTGFSDGKIVAIVSGIVSGVAALLLAAFFVIRAIIPVGTSVNASSFVSSESSQIQIESNINSSQVISSSIAKPDEE